ncbi:hypothetical protein K3495_g11578 [Podosphaera aphanis]|nr:hypothetical protein K3495_g11578 [Podosphaera aphanis]
MNYTKTKLDIPVLSQETHERWFRNISVLLRANGVLYVTTQSLQQFAALKKPDKIDVGEITDGVADFDINDSSNKSLLNLELKATWLKDDATALSIMMQRLNEDDEALVDEHQSTKEMWRRLHKKYAKSSPVAANDNLTAIQTFDFDDYPSITVAWDKLKDF